MSTGLLNPPGSDWTVQMFNQLFGVGWQNFMSGSGGALSMLGNMALIFNGIILSIVILLVGYHFLTAVVESSHSGIPMGRKYHSYWFPVRSALSFMMVGPLPTFKGLCIMQVLVLFLIFKSIGAADTLVNTTTAFFVKNGGQLSLQTQVQANGLAAGVLKTLVLRDYIVTRTPGATADPYIVFDTDRLAFPVTIKAGGTTTVLGSELGYVNVDCSAITLATYCADIMTAVKQMAKTMEPLAEQLATAPSITVANHAATIVLPPTTITDAGDYDTAINVYQHYYAVAAGKAETELNPRYINDLKQWAYSAGNRDGWASLGSWYVQMEDLQSTVSSNFDETPVVMPYDNEKLSSGYLHYDYGPMLANMDQFMSTYSNKYGSIGDMSAVLTSSNENGLSKILNHLEGYKDHIMRVLATPFMAVANKTLDTISGHTLIGSKPVDPVIEISNLGHFAIGTGEAMKIPVIGKLIRFSRYSWYIIAVGMILAFGVPFYPFLTWLLAIVGWFILCLETWIAAPLWGATHMEVSGEGFAGMRARQGYFLFFGVLIRPALMVFSFVISVLTIDVLLWLMATMMKTYFAVIAQNHIVGIISVVAYLTMIVIAASAIMGLAGGLPLWMPNRVLNWLGQLISPLDSKVPVGGTQTLGGFPMSKAKDLSRLGKGSHDKGDGDKTTTNPSAAQTEADRAAFVQAGGKPGDADGAKVADETGQGTGGTNQNASSPANASPPGDSGGGSGGVGPEPANTAGAGGSGAEGGAGGAAATGGEVSAADAAISIAVL